MKLWQLASIARENGALMERVALTRKEWKKFGEWCEHFNEFVKTQDREKLDYVLPDDYVVAVLAASDIKCFRSEDGWIRSWQLSPGDLPLTAVEVYRKFGGSVLEAIFESGSVHVG